MPGIQDVRWSLFWYVRHDAAASTKELVMKKAIAVSSAEFEAQAKKLVSLAFALCENRKKANKYNSSPELRALTTAALSLEQVISAFVAAERLSK